MDALAVVGKIIEVAPIKGADFIVQATVVCGKSGKWSGVTGLSAKVGDLVTVFLQDAVLPPSDRWAFMEKHKWRVRMARFKGAPSECLIVPGPVEGLPGDDLTDLLGVTKHEKPAPQGIGGDAVGSFPSFLPKTDEPNFQKVDFEKLLTSPHYITEKADGTSCTAWVDEDGLHVASRNLELKEFTATGASNVYWQTARLYKLEAMPAGTAVQFEIIGPKIQSNPHGLTNCEGRMFSQFVRDSAGQWNRIPRHEWNLYVPPALLILEEVRPQAENLRKLAEIRYANGQPGEGVVIRADDQSWSFKVINLLYKD